MSEREAHTNRTDSAIRQYDEWAGRRLTRRLQWALRWFATGTLWGHGVRSLIGNPTFALLPWFFLERFAAASGPPISWLWLCAFVLGYPHALYTALEIRHVFETRDHGAGRHSLGKVICFGGQAVLGGGLAVWYVAHGADVLADRQGQDVHALVAGLALGGSVGAVVGLQDVLVIDVLLRPGQVLRAGKQALLSRHWLPVAVPTTCGQAVLAELVLPLL